MLVHGEEDVIISVVVIFSVLIAMYEVLKANTDAVKSGSSLVGLEVVKSSGIVVTDFVSEIVACAEKTITKACKKGESLNF